MIQWLICGLLVLGTGATDFCNISSGDYTKTVCYNNDCTTAIKDHIAHEFHAAFKYLYMGASFGQFSRGRPGMTKFFLESATEERSHANHMMDYLNLRGVKYDSNYEFNSTVLGQPDVTNIESALEEALKMEIGVTQKIHDVIEKCAGDYHAADVFTNPIMEEQHTGIRKLQGASQLMKELKMGLTSGDGHNFAEYIFDQKMLKGEV